MIVALLGLRVTAPLRTIQLVPVISDGDLPGFLKTNSPCIVLFGNRSEFEYASFAVYRYRKTFRFSLASPDAAASLNLSPIPIAAIYNGSSRLFSTYNGTSAVDFAQQIQAHIWFHFPRNRLLLPEELRRILSHEGNCLFGVDKTYTDPFPNFRGDVPFFTVRSEIFKELGLAVTAGYWAYRGVDRNLVRIPDTKVRTYRDYLKTPLIRMDAANFTQRPFLAGFIMDEKNDSAAEEQMRVMRALAPKLPSFAFAPITAEKVPTVAAVGGARFVVWKGGLDSSPQILGGDEVWNETTLAARLSTIADAGPDRESL
jgi:hypothetical protein